MSPPVIEDEEECLEQKWGWGDGGEEALSDGLDRAWSGVMDVRAAQRGLRSISTRGHARSKSRDSDDMSITIDNIGVKSEVEKEEEEEEEEEEGQREKLPQPPDETATTSSSLAMYDLNSPASWRHQDASFPSPPQPHRASSKCADEEESVDPIKFTCICS
jgi:hypothetical protein